MTLTELIERLEKAEAGSRELDACIHALIVNPPVMVDGGSWRGDIPATYEPMTSVLGRLDGADLAEFTGCPRYSESLDAALAILPEGWTPNIFLPPGMRAEVRLFRHAIGLNVHDAIKLDIVAEAATGPLAACTAFLKARAGKDTA